MKNGKPINDFLVELSDLLEKYDYIIDAESGETPTVRIMENLPRFEILYTNYMLDKETISRYFQNSLEWEPHFEPAGTVNFLGKDVTVFKKSGWLAMNKNGYVFYFTDEPTIQNDIHYSRNGSGCYLGTMTGVKNPDVWKTSAMYFNLSENEND